jgi:hypothetical protein
MKCSTRVNALVCEWFDAGVPIQLLKIVFLLLTSTLAAPIVEDVDAVEFFAGQKSITNALRRQQFQTLPYDLEHDSAMNWNTGLGFAMAIRFVLRLKRGSFCWLAPVCGSWVFISRSSTGRCKAYPMGRSTSKSVKEGNKMVSRVAMLIYLLAAKRCWWIIEQPSSSLLYLHTRIQEILMKGGIKIYRTYLELGAYGHDLKKTTHLYSSHPFTDRLSAVVSPGTAFPHYENTVTISYDESGKRKFTGCSSLKLSQRYPKVSLSAIGRTIDWDTVLLAPRRTAAAMDVACDSTVVAVF